MDTNANACETARRLFAAGKIDLALATLEAPAAHTVAFEAIHALQLEMLLNAGRRREAQQAFAALSQLPMTSSDAFDALAFFARRLELHETSNRLYRRATDLAPGDAQLWYNLASSERALGRLEQAAAACDRALALDVDALPSLLLRSELKTQTPQDNHVDELRARLHAHPDDRTQMFGGYALGKELHDLRQYDEAFGWFAKGAAARRRNLSYNVSEDVRKLQRIAEAFAAPAQAESLQSAKGGQHIFIVGLPRSGTTLLERMLGGLAHVRSNGETNNFASALLAHAPSSGGDIFDRCSRAEGSVVGPAYDALATATGSDDHIIEKLPLNYLYVGAIHNALPAAPIIWVRRDPLDSCFAMFRTLFGEGYPFSYHFEDLARYVAAYEALMAHWQHVLPGRLIEVHYEDLVSDPARVGRDVAMRCGLDWSDAAIDIASNATASLTASASQIRSPIYRSSAGLWRRYETHLAPLARLLIENGIQPHRL